MTCLEWRISPSHLLLASTVGLAVEVMAASLVPLSMALSMALSLAGGALADSLEMVPLSANPLARLVGPTQNKYLGQPTFSDSYCLLKGKKFLSVIDFDWPT